jgi:hypothetical protein
VEDLPLTEVQTWGAPNLELTFLPPDEWVIVRHGSGWTRLDNLEQVIEHVTLRELQLLGLPPLVILAMQAE